MGDIVHALPALATLKGNFPEWEIDWLVESRWRGLLQGNGCLSRVVELDTLRWRASLLAAGSWRELGRAVGELRRRDYAWALDLQGAFKSAVACRASGAKRVAGFEGAWLREPGASIFYTRRLRSDAIHAVEAGMSLAAAAGASRPVAAFPLPPGNERELPPGLLSAAFAVVNPAAGWPAKQWMAAGYAGLCDMLHRDHCLLPVLNCGPGEELLSEQVRSACRIAQPQIFRGSVAALIALLRRARLMVGPDTGPVHLAASLGVPTLGLYGPTDPRRNGPYGVCVRTVRAPNAQTSHNRLGTGDDSMQRITLPQVMEAVQILLSKQPVPPVAAPCAVT
jgi:heptosyltransferase-1